MTSRILLALYSGALGLILPFYRWRRRLVGRPVAPARARSRDFPLAGARPTIWLHGVSVGEVLAARSLVAALGAAYPEYELLISCSTPAGMDVARREYPDHRLFFCPYDLAGPVRRALDAVKPTLIVLVEAEIWPRLLDECRRRGTPVALVNGKVSERSRRGYRRLVHVLPALFEAVRVLAVQDEEQARRFLSLGLAEARIRVTGSIKVDNLRPAASAEAGLELRRALGLGVEPVLLAGSTHEGEDETVLEATLAIRSNLPNMRLVLAPRHLERIPALEAHAGRRGLSTSRRSAGASDAAVILVDTMGELAALFAAADLVFLGGSLVPRGGHNLLEPAAAGKVQLVGPDQRTMADFAAELAAADVLHVVRDGDDLATRAREILVRSPREMKRAADAARTVVERHRGATERTMSFLRDSRLPPDRTNERRPARNGARNRS